MHATRPTTPEVVAGARGASRRRRGQGRHLRVVEAAIDPVPPEQLRSRRLHPAGGAKKATSAVVSDRQVDEASE